MIITLKWLNDHRTARNGFTRAQVEALGMRWPPKPKGWLRRQVGREISDEIARKFEEGAHKLKRDPLYDMFAPVWEQK